MEDLQGILNVSEKVSHHIPSSFSSYPQSVSESNITPVSSISLKICPAFAGVLPTKTFNLNTYCIKVSSEILFTKNVYHIETNQYICIRTYLTSFCTIQVFTERYFPTDIYFLDG